MKEYIARTTAILVDGGYYRKRAEALWGKKRAEQRAEELVAYCMLHITEPEDPRDLYRIFYYDCPPMSRIMKHPLDGTEIDFSEGAMTKWTKLFYEELSAKMKIALRMGELAESVARYNIKPDVMEELLRKERIIEDLEHNDFYVDVKQKGVEFILDPMKQNPKKSLLMHVDFVETYTDKMYINN